MPSLKPSLAAADRAFPSQPRLDRYYAAATIEAARARISQCVLRGDGPVMLLGAPGVGKTMLLEVLRADLTPHLRVVRLAGAQLCTRRALLQAILHGLGGPYRNREEGELRIALSDLVTSPAETGDGVALLIDEAQTLPLRLLEELRQLANHSLEGVPRVRLVLAGAHSLDEAFTSPELEAFSQRLAARCYLEPLSRDETSQYVRAHIGAAGGDPDTVLSADAYEAIGLASDGLPRLINQVVDRALTLASQRGAAVLGHEAISEAWSDLHQLAAPWQSPSKASLAAAATPADSPGVEYGLLEEGPAAYEEFDLQAEAAAVMALGEQVGVEREDWIAADEPRASLHAEPEGPASESAPGEGDDEFVSFAFPTVVAEQEESPEPGDADLASTGQPEAQDDLIAESPVATGETERDGVTQDPFAEAFEEEETLLDPSAERERVIPSAPLVTPLVAADVNQAFAAYQESLSPSVAAAPPEAPEVSPVFEAVEAAPSAEPDNSRRDDILLIDDDDKGPAEAAPAHRQDYAELFANLREG